MKERHQTNCHQNERDYLIDKFIFPLNHVDVQKLLREKVKDTKAPYYNKVRKLFDEHGNGKKFKKMVLSSSVGLSVENDNDEEDIYL